jgi:hypothetical protein
MVFGRYHESKEHIYTSKFNAFGIRELTEKEAFIRQNQVDYLDQVEYSSNWGESYGKNLAKIEDNYLATQLISGDNITCDAKSLEQTINEQIEDFQSKEVNRFILYAGKEISKRLYGKNQFVPNWHNQNQTHRILGLKGFFDKIPVLYFGSLPNNTIILIDISSFGVLTQHKVPDSPDFPLDIHITPLSINRAK